MVLCKQLCSIKDRYLNYYFFKSKLNIIRHILNHIPSLHLIFSVDKKGKTSDLKTDSDASESSGYGSCCPHVVDEWLFFGILAGLGITVFLLRMQITMFIVGRKRRRKRNENLISDSNYFTSAIDVRLTPSYKHVVSGRKNVYQIQHCFCVKRHVVAAL